MSIVWQGVSSENSISSLDAPSKSDRQENMSLCLVDFSMLKDWLLESTKSPVAARLLRQAQSQTYQSLKARIRLSLGCVMIFLSSVAGSTEDSKYGHIDVIIPISCLRGPLVLHGCTIEKDGTIKKSCQHSDIPLKSMGCVEIKIVK